MRVLWLRRRHRPAHQLPASLTCDAGPTWDDETSGLAPYFWAFFALWPVLVPLGFLALLLRVRKPVAAQRATPLSRATSFLWRDYAAGFLFIDQEYGSRKLLRTVVAAIVSAMFLTILALARPYRRSDDLCLACIANLLLTCCFASGVVIQVRAPAGTSSPPSLSLIRATSHHPLPTAAAVRQHRVRRHVLHPRWLQDLAQRHHLCRRPYCGHARRLASCHPRIGGQRREGEDHASRLVEARADARRHHPRRRPAVAPLPQPRLEHGAGLPPPAPPFCVVCGT